MEKAITYECKKCGKKHEGSINIPVYCCGYQLSVKKPKKSRKKK